LLKFSRDLLESGLGILGALRILSRARGKQIAAKDAYNRHGRTSSRYLKIEPAFSRPSWSKFMIGKTFKHFSRPYNRQMDVLAEAIGAPIPRARTENPTRRIQAL